MLEILKRSSVVPVSAASLRDALREIEAKLPGAREVLAAAQRERADLLLSGSDKEIVAAEARITSARIAVDRYEAATGELARKAEEAEIAEAEAALDAEYRAVEARAAALSKRIVPEYAKHAAAISALLQEIVDADAAINALNQKLHAARRDVIVPHVEERAISTGTYGIIKDVLRDTTSLLPMRDGAGWGYGRDFARRTDFKVQGGHIMAKEKRIPLSEPVPGHSELIREVVLREPRASDLWSIGEPFVWARNADGSMLPVENSEAIRSYIERCCTSPDPLLLGNLCLADAMAVKEAVLSFFVSSQATSTTPAASSSLT